MAKKKSNTIWWVLGLGAVAYYLYTQQQAAATAAAAAATPGQPAPALPAGVTALPAGNVQVLPINTTLQVAPTPPPSAVVQPPAPTAATVVNPAAASPVQANPPTLSSSVGPIGPGEVTDAGVPYDPRMSTLQTWATTSLNPCDLGRWNTNQTNFTPAEWNGLYDLYFNDWIGGQGNTAARQSFWDTWRTKYSILTNTPC
jgi:hypothetical protein